MKVKNVGNELYDQRYAFIKYTQGKKSVMKERGEMQDPSIPDLSTSRTNLKGLTQ